MSRVVSRQGPITGSGMECWSAAAVGNGKGHVEGVSGNCLGQAIESVLIGLESEAQAEYEGLQERLCKHLLPGEAVVQHSTAMGNDALGNDARGGKRTGMQVA